MRTLESPVLPFALRSVDGHLDNGSLQNRPGRHECHRGTESRGGLVPSPRATQRCPFNGQFSAVVGVLRVFGSAFGTPFCGKSLKYSPTPAPLCDIPSGCCSFAGPWTVTRSSLRMLRRVAVFYRPLRPVLLLVSFPRSRSPVVGVLGLC